MTVSIQQETPRTVDGKTYNEVAELLKKDISALSKGERVSEIALNIPRSRKDQFALDTAALLYPTTPAGSLACIIRYDEAVTHLRRQIRLQREEDEEAKRAALAKTAVKAACLRQGPWDELNDPISLGGATSLPMPVKVSDAESLEPFFRFLAGNGKEVDLTTGSGVDQGLDVSPGQEPYYAVDMLEFQKGVVYTDQRMDLCKMVVGPQHIGALMDALEKNDFVRHFLLGNNIIGPAGVRRISQFLERHPDKMETWYLAGNCINSSGFASMVDGLVPSKVLHSLWLKRNPLGAASAAPLHRLITQSPILRTLDLDQTELGDAGVAELFSLLFKDIDKPVALRTLYLNGNGIHETGAKSIAAYIAHPSCPLESLFLSYNPLGDAGALPLAAGLKQNTSLLRFTAVACGLKNAGVRALFDALASHPRLISLDVGHGFATYDLGQRHNYFDDDVQETVASFIRSSPTIRILRLGYNAMSPAALNRLLDVVASSSTLFWYMGDPAGGHPIRRATPVIGQTLERNVKAHYGEEVGWQNREAGDMRFVRNTPDVRYIDSVYRNRDAGLARRKLKVLDKWWDAGDGTLEMVEMS